MEYTLLQAVVTFNQQLGGCKIHPEGPPLQLFWKPPMVGYARKTLV
jgi:hypothetical protein